MNNQTLEGWIKAEKLADYTGLRVRAVRAQIAANVQAGWLEIVQSGNSSGLANTYRLTYPKGVVQNTLESSVSSKGVVDDTLRVSSSAEKGVVDDTPTTPRTTPRNFSKSSEERTSPKEKGVVHDTIPSDPLGSGDITFPANPTSEFNRVVNDTLENGVADDTLAADELDEVMAEHRAEVWPPANPEEHTPPFGNDVAPFAKSSAGTWDPFAD